MKPLLKKVNVALVLAGFVSSASATLVTIPGVNFDITYDDAKLGAYGVPTLVGNIISFTPTGYVAQSLNGLPATLLDLEAQTINLRITMHDLVRITSIAMSEGGDYIKHGSLSAVGVSGQTRAWDLAQPAGTQIVQGLVVSPLNITNAGVPNIDFSTHNWTAGTTTDMSWPDRFFVPGSVTHFTT
jgi:hypothetical protein